MLPCKSQHKLQIYHLDRCAKKLAKNKKKNLFVKFRSGFSHRKVGWIVGFFLVFWGKGYEKNCAACHANQETNNRLCSVLLQFFLATTMCWIFFLPHSALRIHRCCCWRGCCKLFFFFLLPFEWQRRNVACLF